MTVALVLLILLSTTFNAFAQIALRKAMLVAAPGMPPLTSPVALGLHLITNLYLWGGLLLFGASIALWLGVLARVPVSAAYPMASLGYVVAAATGVMLLGETVTLGRAVGLVVICLGVFIVGRTV